MITSTTVVDRGFRWELGVSTETAPNPFLNPFLLSPLYPIAYGLRDLVGAFVSAQAANPALRI
jgi:hypothetical protein